jgi:hypothetical protein
METKVNYANVLRSAAESLTREGRHNQADILKDAADAFAALTAERDAYKLALEELASDEPTGQDQGIDEVLGRHAEFAALVLSRNAAALRGDA